MPTAVQRHEGPSRAKQDDRHDRSGRPDLAQPDIDAILQAREALLRSAAALGEEIAGFAGARLRDNQEMLRSMMRCGSAADAYGLQWDYTLSAARQYLEEAQKLADLVTRMTEEGWSLMQVASRVQGATVAEPIEKAALDWSAVTSDWRSLEKTIKAQWDKLTDEDLAAIVGSRDRLLARIQERYRVAREDAERQIGEFERRHAQRTG